MTGRSMTEHEFEQFMKQYEKLVFTVCYQLVRDYHEAQNLTQETFLSAYQHLDGYKGDNYKPWLIRIASNKAKDYLKSAYVRRVQYTLEEENAPEPVSLAPLPAALTEAKEGEQLAREAIEQLGEPYHQVCTLYFLGERSVEEIAKELDRPKKTVQTQLYRGKILLQQRLREEL